MAGAASTATVAFGGGAGTDRASVTVSGQTGLTTAGHAEAWISRDTTSDHSADEHEQLARDSRVLTEITGAGVFVVSVVCDTTWTGDFAVHWVWNDA